MPNTISPNMSLIIPTIGQELSPTWASDLNASLSIIDGHNHTPGEGVQIPPAGLNINSDLTMNGNNLTMVRTVKFSPQGAPLSLPADVGVIYEVGVDLYYNDGSGNQIRITQSGSVAGAAGTITGLPSGTASVSYSAGTFTFQKATGVAATLDIGDLIIRKETLGSAGITLHAPNALAVNETLTLPLLPATTSFMSLDSSGNISTFPTDALPSSSQFLRMDSSGAIHFINLYDIVVGPGGDFSTIGAAITAASASQSIYIEKGTYVENVTVNKQLNITGNGRGTIISGSITFATGSDDSLMQDFKVTANLTINSGVSEVYVAPFWNGSASTVTDNGTGSYLQYMQE